MATRAGELGRRTVAMALDAGERWRGECRDCGHTARLNLVRLARRCGPNLYLASTFRAVTRLDDFRVNECVSFSW